MTVCQKVLTFMLIGTNQNHSSPNQVAVNKKDLFVETDSPYPIE